jgi:predicted outer membrane repeat protein
MSVSTEAELRVAVYNAEAGIHVIITLICDIQLTETSLVISDKKNITLTSSVEGPFFKLIGAPDKDTITVNANAVLELAGVIVTHDSGVIGRGVTVQRFGTLTLSAGAISGNIVNGNGGGVYNEGGRFTMFGGTISNNIVNESGGGIYIIDDDWKWGGFCMFGGTISGNTAKLSGGGIYIHCSSFMMTNSTISDNTASTVNGGGIYLDNSLAKLLSGTVSNNIASKDGGGIWVSFENLNKLFIYDQMAFTNNYASKAYNRNPTHDTIYITQIESKMNWTTPFKQGYNNYDISYTKSTPTQQP